MDIQFKRTVSLVSIVLFGIGIAQGASVPTVQTSLGSIEGILANVLFNGNDYIVSKYLGIPFAKPPVGELRLAKPVPVEKFVSPYTATSYGKVCPQQAMPGIPEYDVDKMSEDCLFLNVFVPEQKPDNPKGHSVMIWIHGGGFSFGSATEYSANTLAAFGNVIVVSINYRLGFFGFASSGDSNAPGNFGLWDQHLAFKWVNENIGAFGGDNSRVTIFGESAGGISVGYQSLFPQNKDLFQRGIQESGNAAMSVCYRDDVVTPTKFLAERLNCAIHDSREMIACLKGVDFKLILSTIKDIVGDDYFRNSEKVSFQPTTDEDFFKKSPHKMVLDVFNGNDVSPEVNFFRSIDIIFGANSHEGAAITAMGWVEKGNVMDTKHVPFGMLFGLGPNVPKAVFDMVIAEYTNWENPDDPIKHRDEFVQLIGDIFAVSAVRSSSVHSNATNINSYQYMFRPRPSNTFLPTPNFVNGANHMDEIGFVFGFDEESLKLMTEMYGKEIVPVQEWETSLATTVMTYWTNFAKSGNPNKPSQVPVEWPKHSPDTQKYLSIDKGPDGVTSQQYLSARRANFWLKVVPSVMEAINIAQDSSVTVSKQEQDTCSKDGGCGDA